MNQSFILSLYTFTCNFIYIKNVFILSIRWHQIGSMYPHRGIFLKHGFIVKLIGFNIVLCYRRLFLLSGVLRQYVCDFRSPSRRILEALRIEWWVSTPRFSSTLERRNVNINLSQNFISTSGDRTLNQWVLQSLFVPLRHDWPYENYLIDSI